MHVEQTNDTPCHKNNRPRHRLGRLDGYCSISSVQDALLLFMLFYVLFLAFSVILNLKTSLFNAFYRLSYNYQYHDSITS
nr:MAG TPA: hypothetical protein [Caudoviricetes sp.]